MKKPAAIILIFLYSFATVGTTVAMHYCMGDRIGASLGYSVQSSCERCHMKKHSEDDTGFCCKDENHFVKVTTDQDLSVFPASPSTPVYFIKRLISLSDIPPAVTLMIEKSTCRIEPPDITIYQRNCNFRI